MRNVAFARAVTCLVPVAYLMACGGRDVTRPEPPPNDTIHSPPPPPPRFIPAVTQLRFQAQPYGGAAGAPLARAVVTLHDSTGALVPIAAEIELTATVLDTAVVLKGITRGVTDSGTARFDSLVIERSDSSYRLHANIPGLADVRATSVPFVISAGEPQSLSYRAVPLLATSGYPVRPAVEVELRDRFGNLVIEAVDTVRIVLASPATGARASGRLAAKPTGGIARFDSVVVDGNGTGYRLQARTLVVEGPMTPAFGVELPMPITHTGSPLASGALGSCVIEPSGSLACWGANTSGELHDGRRLESTVPLFIGNSETYRSIEVGDGFACGLRTNRSVECWGSNSAGSLGDGTRLHRSVPTRVPNLTASRVRVSGTSACAVSEAGPTLCWGYDRWQHDDPTANRLGALALSPRIKTNEPLRQLSMKGASVCGLTTAGQLVCWHDDGGAQALPVNPPLVDLVLANSVNCGLSSDGGLWCGSGQLMPSNPEHLVPDMRFRSLSQGNGRVCALSTNDRMLCLGGAGDWYPADTLDFAFISPGIRHSCALTAAGEAWCWGNNERGQLGDGTREDRTAPMRVATHHSFTSISAGAASTCAVGESGLPMCWGDNSGGVLGDEVPVWRHTPVSSSAPAPLRYITSGTAHSCGLDAQGAAWCWGSNSSGQLGDGTRHNRSTATRAAAGMTFAALAAGAQQTCGLDVAGRAWCWGQDASGRDGDDRLQPTLVQGGQFFSALTVGGQRACGLTALGKAFCWWQEGHPSHDPPSALSAVAVPGNHIFASISAGAMHVCALTTAGEAWCWGYDGTDDTGAGEPPPYDLRLMANRPLSGSYKSDPVAVPGRAFRSISAGAAATCALDSDGRAWCWGVNRDGRLGNPAVANHSNEPVEVAGGHRFISLSSGGSYLDAHTCGVTVAGEVYCWGQGFYGQLGNGTTARSTTPARVLNVTARY